MGDYVADFQASVWAIANTMRGMENIIERISAVLPAASKRGAVRVCITRTRKSGTKEIPVSIRSGLKAKSSLITFPPIRGVGDLPVLHNISLAAIRTRRLRSMGETRLRQDIADKILRSRRGFMSRQKDGVHI